MDRSGEWKSILATAPAAPTATPALLEGPGKRFFASYREFLFVLGLTTGVATAMAFSALERMNLI